MSPLTRFAAPRPLRGLSPLDGEGAGSGRSDLAGQQRNELLVFPNEALSGYLSLTVFCSHSGFEPFDPEFSFSTRRLE
jgi:hypothetical protein